jgi:hypothetical protein
MVKQPNGGKSPPQLEIGNCYYVRTVTDHWVGRCVSLGPHSITLEDAAWIAESGRLHEFMSNGRAENMEVEPVGYVCVQWLAWLPWPHALFREAV